MKPAAEPGYRAVWNAVGWRDESQRAKLEVRGPDAVSFLHAMISNDVSRLPLSGGRYGTFLSATGKILADFYYYRLEDRLLIDIASELGAGFQARLAEFIILDDVELEDVSERYSHFSLQGPQTAVLLSRLVGGEMPEAEHDSVAGVWADQPVRLIRRNRLSATGVEILLPRAGRETFRTALQQAGRETDLEMEEISPAAAEVLRLEQVQPLYGVDMSEQNNPLEARLQSAYSLTKGCYPGQEVVSRATNIGGVARLLTPLKVKGPAVPAAGTPVVESAETKVGWVTSAAFSPGLDSVIALAYLKRAVAEPGRRLQLVSETGVTQDAETVERFL